jgi:hypothetical protein
LIGISALNRGIQKLKIPVVLVEIQMYQKNKWLRISMDRISDSDSEDAGSIPAGAT